VKDGAEAAAKGTKSGVSEAGDIVKDAGDATKKGLDQAAKDTKKAAKKAGGSAERTTKDAASTAKKDTKKSVKGSSNTVNDATDNAKTTATNAYKSAAAETKHTGRPTRAAVSTAGYASRRAGSQAASQWNLAANEVRRAFGMKPKPAVKQTPINEVPSDATPVEKK
jgi:hypothetical protein